MTVSESGCSSGDSLLEMPSAKLPRVLILDVSRPGGEGATGQLSKTLFGNWAEGQLMHLYWDSNWAWRIYYNGRYELVRLEDVVSVCTRFDPDVVYCRPVNHPLSFYQMTLFLIRRLEKPYVVHIMDDWLARLRWYDEKLASVLESSMRELLTGASARLSISKAMTEAFATKFGGLFQSVSNGVDLQEFRPLEQEALRLECNAENPFVVRYCGGLNEDMNRDSVLSFAQVASRLSERIPIQLEVYTKSHYANFALQELMDLPSVAVLECVSDEEYPELLRSSDLLLIAYNFDRKSVDYTRYSFANKLPEILASGTPVFALGPQECATIQFVMEEDCGQVALATSKIEERLLEIYYSNTLRERYSAKGLDVVAKHFQLSAMRRKLERALLDASEIADNGLSRAVHGDLGVRPASIEFIFPLDAVCDLLSKVTELNGTAHSPRIAAYLGERACRLETCSGWTLLDLLPLQGADGQVLEAVLERLRKNSQEHGKLALLLDCPALNYQLLRRILGEKTGPMAIVTSFDDCSTEKMGYNFHQLAAVIQRNGYEMLVVEKGKSGRSGRGEVWKSVARYPCILEDAFSKGLILSFRTGLAAETVLEQVESIMNVSIGNEKVKAEP